MSDLQVYNLLGMAFVVTLFFCGLAWLANQQAQEESAKNHHMKEFKRLRPNRKRA